jgi:hypothetical protein
VLGVRRIESGDWRGGFGRLGFIGVVFFIYLKNIYPADFCFGAGWVLDLVRKEGGWHYLEMND